MAEKTQEAQQLRPIIFKEANTTLTGRTLTDEERKYGDKSAVIKDVPCFRDGKIVVTRWEATFVQRLIFLFTGKVNVITLGTSQPPMSLSVGEPFNQ